MRPKVDLERKYSSNIKRMLATANDAIGHTKQFASYVVDGWEWLRGNKPKQQQYSKSELTDFHNMVTPAATTTGTTLNIGVNHGTVVNYNVTMEAANTIQNRAAHQISMNRMPAENYQQDVLLTFYQVRDEVVEAAGDKGIIESISSRPLKVIFSDPVAKNAVLENPFQKVFLVDVKVETVGGQPRLYNVLAVKDIFDK